MTRLLLLVLLFPLMANTQEVFQKEITHTLSFSVYDMVILPDNGYMACGYLVPNPQDSSLAVVARLDSMLQVQWCKRIKVLEKDYFRCITALSDGNFLIGGTGRYEYSSFSGGSLYKMDASGNIIWNKLYNDSFDDTTMEVFEQSDNTLVLFIRYGVFGQPTKILKTDSNGNLLHEFSIYNDNMTIGVFGDCVTKTISGAYFLAGTVYSPTSGTNIYFIAKTSDVALIWYHEYDFGRNFAQLYGIAELSDGNIAVTGSLADTTTANLSSIGAMKVDQNSGSVIWAKEIKQMEAYTQFGYGISPLENNELLLCSRATTALGTKAFAAHLDESGNVSWARQYGNGSYNGFGIGMERSGGRFLFLGKTELYGGTYLVQTDAEGFSPCFTDLLNFYSSDLTVNVYTPPRNIGDPEVEVMSPSYEESSITLSENIICSGTVVIEETPNIAQFKVYPNPADFFITVEDMNGQNSSNSIEIYNTQGMLIYHTGLDRQKEVIETPFIPGLYFIIIMNDRKDVLQFQKIIIR